MRKPPLIPSIITLAFVILMTNLGFWQLSRAKEKQEMLLLLANDNITQIIESEQVKDLPQYANVQITGKFIDAPQLILDNQIDNQVVGYHVFTPFLIKGLNMYIMINRGWVAKQDFEKLNLSMDSKSVTLLGKLNHSPQVGIQLGEIELDANKKQQIITYFDRPKVSKFLHETLCESLNCIVSDRVILLDKKQGQKIQAFKREWNSVVMPPAKHTGYAVQWFSMTLVLIILFFYWVSKLKD